MYHSTDLFLFHDYHFTFKKIRTEIGGGGGGGSP